MTYWNEKKDNHIQYWSTPAYPSYYRNKHEITEEGYRGDMLQKSKVVYLGSCDVMSNIENKKLRWIELLRDKMHPNEPLIALGTVASGLPSMVRRLYAYIQNFGAPEIVYMSVPRFDGYEHVNRQGKCYNLSTRTGSVNFCKRVNLVDEQDHEVWLTEIECKKKMNSIYSNRYILEERFAFIETLCKLHNINLKWTFNPSDASIVVLYQNITIFNDISDFMKKSFVGLPYVKDQAYDRSVGPETHKEIFEKFINPEPWDYEKFCKVAQENYIWASARYGKEIIKMENE